MYWKTSQVRQVFFFFAVSLISCKLKCARIQFHLQYNSRACCILNITVNSLLLQCFLFQIIYCHGRATIWRVGSCKVMVDVCRLTVKLSRHEFISRTMMSRPYSCCQICPCRKITRPDELWLESVSSTQRRSEKWDLSHAARPLQRQSGADEEIHQAKSLSEP